jgi:hypothetical protein
MSKIPYSPYNNTTPGFRKKMLYWSGIFTVVITVIFNILDQSLVTPGDEVADGMVAFELTNNIHDARIMVDMWGEKGRLVAAFSLGLDYLYLIAYALFLGIIAFETGKKLTGRSALLAKPGYWLSWLMILAAVYDAIENFALIRILTGCQYSLWATTAYYFATIKFAIVIITLVYIFLGLVMMWVTRPSKNQPA